MKSSRQIAVVSLWIACAGMAVAQTDMRGHWSGSLATPGGALGMEVDLSKSGADWVGSVSIPDQGVSGMPLETISFSAGKGTFHIKGAPGDPAFTGTLAADGKSMDGEFSQGPAKLPMKFTRTGEAKVVVPKASPAVAAEFLGTWEGTIPAGPGIRVVLTISNGKTGAEAHMTSPDQGDASIPVGSVTQNGKNLTLDVNAISGGYEGALNPEGTKLTGMWSQMGNSIVLVFNKVGAAKP